MQRTSLNIGHIFTHMLGIRGKKMAISDCCCCCYPNQQLSIWKWTKQNKDNYNVHSTMIQGLRTITTSTRWWSSTLSIFPFRMFILMTIFFFCFRKKISPEGNENCTKKKRERERKKRHLVHTPHTHTYIPKINSKIK